MSDIQQQFSTAMTKDEKRGFGMSSDTVLRADYAYGSVVHRFDFALRIMYSTTNTNDGGVTITPFSQLDREVLEALRNRLIELGGNPPALAPAAAPVSKLLGNQQVSR